MTLQTWDLLGMQIGGCYCWREPFMGDPPPNLGPPEGISMTAESVRQVLVLVSKLSSQRDGILTSKLRSNEMISNIFIREMPVVQLKFVSLQKIFKRLTLHFNFFLGQAITITEDTWVYSEGEADKFYQTKLQPRTKRSEIWLRG